MKEGDLKELPKEDLKKNERGLQTLIGIMIATAAFLLFFVIRDRLNGEELEMSLVIIAICSVGGAVSLFPRLKEFQTELKSRSEK